MAYHDIKKIQKSLLQAFVDGADCIPTEIEQVVRRWMAAEESRENLRELPKAYATIRDEILSDEVYPPLCRHQPQLLADVIRHQLIWQLEIDNPPDKDEDEDLPAWRWWTIRNQYLQALGIRRLYSWNPPTAFQGPFLGLLRVTPEIAINVILELTNHATDVWVSRMRHPEDGASSNSPLPQRLLLGTREQEIWGNTQVWRWFRYPTAAPNAVTCALMALEYWLSEQIKAGANPQPLFDRLMQRSKSAAIIGTLSSVAMKHPQQCAQAILPVLHVPAFWMMDQDRLREEPHENSLAILANFAGGGHDWSQLQQTTREDHRKQCLEHLALWLMLTDTRYREPLLPVIRTFKEHLPYTHEQQVGDPVVEAELRRICELMALRTDVENFKLVDLGDEKIGFEPQVIPEHLVEIIQENDERLLLTNKLMALRLWAQKSLAGEADVGGYTPETALAAAQHIATEEAEAFQEPFLAWQRTGVAILVAAALSCCYSDWLQKPEDIHWCREQLINAFTANPDSHLFGDEVVAARALPALLAKLPTDSELRELVCLLAIHPEERTRATACAAIRSLWPAFPHFVWGCLAFGIGLALREQSRRRTQPTRDLTSWRDRMIKQITDGKPVKSLETLRDKTSQDVNWFVLESTSLLLPDRGSIPHSAWQGRLLPLYVDWMDFLLAVYLAAEEEDYQQDTVPYRPDAWARRLFEAVGWHLVFSPPDQTGPVFIDQLLQVWEQVPSVMEIFLRVFLQVGSARELPREGFVAMWKRIGQHVLSANRIQTKSFHYQRQIETILAILIFSELGAKWNLDTWEPLDSFTDLISHWCATVGSVPSCFRALIRLLSTIGFPLFVTNGLRWITTCLDGSSSPEDMLRQNSNAPALAQLLTNAYQKYKGALRSSPETLRQFNTLVDWLIRIGEPMASDLRQQMRRQ